jgi:hypothetical protein
MKGIGKRIPPLFVRALLDPDLSAMECRVLLYLDWRQGLNDSAWPTQATIAADLHLTPDGVRKIIRRLMAKGWVQVTRPTHTAPGKGLPVALSADRQGRQGLKYQVAQPENHPDSRVCRQAGRVCRQAGRVCRQAGRVCRQAGHVCRQAGRVCRQAGRVCRQAGHVCRQAGRVCRQAGHVCRQAGRKRLAELLACLPLWITAADLDRLCHEAQCPEFWQRLRRKHAAAEAEPAAAKRRWQNPAGEEVPS